jgi:hypothetical protein
MDVTGVVVRWLIDWRQRVKIDLRTGEVWPFDPATNGKM